MGIRYYAYAFDPQNADLAVADPDGFISADPLADAWGFPHGAESASPTFEQAVPPRDMLYLDKAWSAFQSLTRAAEGHSARPSFRMFEGAVVQHAYGWERFVRALVPEEMPAIAADLADMDQDWLERHLCVPPQRDSDEELEYLTEFLGRARRFTASLVEDGRGMVYMIG
ncbi:DUF1877 family protein [Arenivirga flava]|uniref:DUF1877 domain-containing protein n=1 Tax=Arenivirga flava TaxID=1930060 RepID=A0AA37XC87_9MICO|nr:DUF1877 family protein [Arenivirga flava]GMA29731.1 hypothetical protein GCM10025874_29840 [Arenivirga flava]